MYKYLFKNKSDKVVEMEKLCLNNKFIILDFEISSLGSNDLLEIGAIALEDSKIIDQYSSLIKPDVEIDKIIVNLTKITDYMVRKERSEKVVVREFLDWIIPKIENGYIIVAHNASFDMARLYAKLEQHNRTIANSEEIKHICTLQLSRFYLPLFQRHSLDNLCHCFAVPLESHHRALDDCKMTAKYFIKLQKNLVPLSMSSEYNSLHELAIRSLRHNNPLVVNGIDYWEKQRGKKTNHRLFISTNKETFVYNLDKKFFFASDNKSKIEQSNKIYYALIIHIEDKFKVKINSRSEFYKFMKEQFLLSENIQSSLI